MRTIAARCGDGVAERARYVDSSIVRPVLRLLVIENMFEKRETSKKLSSNNQLTRSGDSSSSRRILLWGRPTAIEPCRCFFRQAGLQQRAKRAKLPRLASHPLDPRWEGRTHVNANRNTCAWNDATFVGNGIALLVLAGLP